MKVTRRNVADISALKIAVQDLGNKKLNVGFFDTSKYDDGTPVAYVATIQEFGHGAIPARPFMRPTARKKESAWRDKLAAGAKDVLNGKETVTSMLDKFGAQAAGDIQQAIVAVTTPPLAMSTLLMRKRRKNPDFKAGGAAVGQAVRDASFTGPRAKSDKTLDISGISTKPLIDSDLMYRSVSRQVTDK